MYARTKRYYVLEPNTFVLAYPTVFLRLRFADDDDSDDNDLCVFVSSRLRCSISSDCSDSFQVFLILHTPALT